MLLKTLFIGYVILVGAILLNGIAYKLSLATWYDFLNGISQQGNPFLKTLNFFDYLWLFIIYPFGLGLCYQLGLYLFNYFFNQ